MNLVCGGGWATIRAVGEDEYVPLTDWAKAQCIAHGCDEFPGQSAEEIDETIWDCIMDGEECPVAMAYAFATQAVHLRDRLKAIEDVLGDEYDLNRMRELVQAENTGRLVELPCNVGDMVWTNFAMSGWYFKSNEKPYSAKVVFVGVNHADEMGGGFINVVYEKHNNMMQFLFSDFGKTVFLSRAEAESALEAIKKTEDLTPPSEPQI